MVDLPQIQFHFDRGVVEWRWSGRVTLEGMQTAVLQAARDPSWDARFDHLVVFSADADVSGLQLPDISTTDANLRRWQSSEKKMARVRSATVFERGLAGGLQELWQRMAAGGAYREIRLFDNREDALAWLLSHDT
ncbi:hypothetical protein RMQ97_13170 [Maricaulis sp. D1M11]|uniref:hypothetical protein n=1 Tax=Maricaulis sp. D1M11 TaxID=3076117 RepID=UPI0039B4E5C6